MKSDLNIRVGKLLSVLRTEKGLSQEKLGNQANLDRSYISRIERGVLSPSVTNLYKICKVLEITPGTFLNKVDKQ